MIEQYIYLLAKSFFWVFTILFLLITILQFDEDYKLSRENNKKDRIQKGTYHSLTIKTLWVWTLYLLSILIYFK